MKSPHYVYKKRDRGLPVRQRRTARHPPQPLHVLFVEPAARNRAATAARNRAVAAARDRAAIRRSRTRGRRRRRGKRRSAAPQRLRPRRRSPLHRRHHRRTHFPLPPLAVSMSRRQSSLPARRGTLPHLSRTARGFQDPSGAKHPSLVAQRAMARAAAAQQQQRRRAAPMHL